MRDAATADAPGRVNLMGEHTDYHEGFVLPMVIPLRTSVHLTRRADRCVRARSAAMPDQSAGYELGYERRGNGWLDFVQGATALLAADGTPLSGFDIAIDSTIPLGAGVSSSAALAVSLLRGLRTLFDLSLDDVALAKLAQRIESEFVGAPVGIMDQMASSLGHDGEALYLDTRSLAFERIPIPPTIEIAVIDSGISHRHAGGEYVTRRRESFAAAERLGVSHLRDLDAAGIARIDSLPPTLARRARHIVGENARVHETVAALRAGDGVRVGALFLESHRSMRDDFEASTPEVDLLVELAAGHDRVYGARLTGGGFGGAVIIAAAAGAGADAAQEICAAYRKQVNREAVTLVPAVRSSVR